MRVEGLKAVIQPVSAPAPLLLILFGVKNLRPEPESALHELLLAAQKTLLDDLAVFGALCLLEVVRLHLLFAEVEDLAANAVEVLFVCFAEVPPVEQFREEHHDAKWADDQDRLQSMGPPLVLLGKDLIKDVVERNEKDRKNSDLHENFELLPLLSLEEVDPENERDLLEN